MKSVFLSYSHKDEGYRAELETHLAMLRRQGVISIWHDRRLVAGDEIDASIDKELENAAIILLLVSPDFIASQYCYSREMTRALERHEIGEARVIPVILRPCDWTHAPFGKLLAAPTDGKPISKWPDKDDAYLDVTKALRAAAGRPELAEDSAIPREFPPFSSFQETRTGEPRSSNLRVTKEFTERDRDMFLDEGFEFMAKFFENSLQELQTRNAGLETRFKRIDANNFTADIHRDGKNLTRCQIRNYADREGGITFSENVSSFHNGYNEKLSVEANDQFLYFNPTGMAAFDNWSENSVLSREGAAEYYWALFLKPLQQQSRQRRNRW